MAQNYEDQGGIIKGKQQNVRVYVGNLQTNTDVLRSNFSGASFPDAPVAGQHCYRTDEKIEYIYDGTTWVECDSNTLTSDDVSKAGGSMGSLTARLSVALNPDGTLKAGAEINMDEWKDSLTDPSYLNSDKFAVSHDMSNMFKSNRTIKLEGEGTPVTTSVKECIYDAEYMRTIVTVNDAVVPADIKSVKIGIITDSLPNDVVTDDKLQKYADKENAKFTTHDHTGGNGAKIPANGLATDSVITEKIKNGAITSEKIALHSVTVDHLDSNVLHSSDISSRSFGYKNHISDGLHLVPVDEKKTTVSIDSGRANINDQYINYEGGTFNVPTDNVGMLYMKNNSGKPNIGFKSFEWPKMDDKSVVYYTYDNEPTAMVIDKTENHVDLTPEGKTEKITKVSNWIGNTLDAGPDNDVAWVSGTNVFPGINGNRFTIMHCFIPRNVGVDNIPLSLTTAGGTSPFDCYLRYSNWNAYSQSYNAYFVLSRYSTSEQANSAVHPVRIFLNKPCMLILDYDGKVLRFFINGRKVWHQEWNYTFKETGKGTLYINQYKEKNYRGNAAPLFTTIREDVWTEKEIHEIANKAGFQNQYVGYDAVLPEFPGSTSYHMWDFAEEQGNTVLDHGNAPVALNGTLNNAYRYQDGVKKGSSVYLDGDGDFISFGNYSFKNTGYSMFALVTLTGRQEGFIFSNHDGINGIILTVQNEGHIRVWCPEQGYQNTNRYLPYNEPCVVGFVVQNGYIDVYVDNTEPVRLRWKGNESNLPLTFGNYMKPSDGYSFFGALHYLLLAEKAMSSNEVLATFNAYKRRAYRSIADDVLPENTVSLGVVNTNDGVRYIDETRKMGRTINPFGSQKEFLGWYWTGANIDWYIPNTLGQYTAKVNVYSQMQKDAGIMRTIPVQFIQGAPTGTNGASEWNQSIKENYITSDYVRLNLTRFPHGYQVSNDPSQSGWVETGFIGIELEPMADDTKYLDTTI